MLVDERVRALISVGGASMHSSCGQGGIGRGIGERIGRKSGGVTCDDVCELRANVS